MIVLTHSLFYRFISLILYFVFLYHQMNEINSSEEKLNLILKENDQKVKKNKFLEKNHWFLGHATPLAFCCGSVIGTSHKYFESPKTCKKF